jgi:hypothetical protein
MSTMYKEHKHPAAKWNLIGDWMLSSEDEEQDSMSILTTST